MQTDAVRYELAPGRRPSSVDCDWYSCGSRVD